MIRTFQREQAVLLGTQCHHHRVDVATPESIKCIVAFAKPGFQCLDLLA